jgi:glycosyl transferase family 87
LSARSASWPLPSDRRAAPLVAALAVAVFFASWGALHHGFYVRDQIVDTPIYERYGDAMANGQVPYRDFALEYPPAALPMFVVPSLFSTAGDLPAYRRVFEALMMVCGAAAAALVAFLLMAMGGGLGRAAAGVGLAALAPLALGSVVLSRFDLWPALLTVAALAALASGRQRLGLGVLGFALAAKIYPAVLLPLALVYVWRRSGRREALVCGGIFVAVAAACYVPFLVIAPGGVWHSISVQTTRPLQIEALGSSFLLAAHQAFGLSITMRSGHGSQNLAGGAPDALAALQTVAQLAALVYLWWAFARGPASRERLFRFSAAAVVAFIALGKVLSPQFLIWLVPLVPLVRGRRGLAAGGLFVAAMVLTQLWFPYRYWDLALSFAATPSWLVLARDVVLVGLLAVLAWPTADRSPPDRTGLTTV